MISLKRQLGSQLGQRVDGLISDLTQGLLALEPEKTGEHGVRQITTAQRTAEEIVLAGEVYLPPEPGSEDNELPR